MTWNNDLGCSVISLLRNSSEHLMLWGFLCFFMDNFFVAFQCLTALVLLRDAFSLFTSLSTNCNMRRQNYKFSSSQVFRNLPQNSVRALKTVSISKTLTKQCFYIWPVKCKVSRPLVSQKTEKLGWFCSSVSCWWCSISLPSANSKNGKSRYSKHSMAISVGPSKFLQLLSAQGSSNTSFFTVSQTPPPQHFK